MDRRTILIIAASSLFLLCLVFVFVQILGTGKQKVEPVTYTLDFPIMLPEEPGYQGDYLYSRAPRDRWTQEEVDEWFVVPEGENLERLSSANDQLVKKILEAAP